MRLVVDTHAHLTDERLRDEVPGVLARARAAGVAWVVTIASDLADAEATVRMAQLHPRVYASVGIHPHAASSADASALRKIEALAGEPRVVAIGETGLDFHYDNSPRDDQIRSFERHLDIGRRLDLPVVVHAREADGDVRAIIRGSGWTRGVLHCFSGGADLMEEALALGWHISFAGMITFPRWEGADLLRAVPLDRLLVETDSPYLAPVPHRGRRNEPMHVRAVALKAAEIRGDDPDDLVAATTRNATRFYRIDPPVAG